jgi:acetyl esterase
LIHPEAQALLDLMVQRNVPPTHTLSPAEARAFYRDRRGLTQPPPPLVSEVDHLHCEGPHGRINLRLYRPHLPPTLADSSDPLPVLVYFHGGGWVIGDLDTHDTLCRTLANESACAVVAVDYRLGPENRFPCAVDDCIAATYWVYQMADHLRLDPRKIAVGGDSAGGNLAAVVALHARDQQDLPLVFQLLIYPATDMRRGHPSHTTNGQGYLLTADTLRYFHDHYIDDYQHDLDWRASPALHGNFSKLPPSLVLTAGYDPLRDEGLTYAHKLTQAGNPCTYLCFERQIHGFLPMGGVLHEADLAIAVCASSLKKAFAR